MLNLFVWITSFPCPQVLNKYDFLRLFKALNENENTFVLTSYLDHD